MRDLQKLLSKPVKPCRSCGSQQVRNPRTGKLGCKVCKNTYYQKNKSSILEKSQSYRFKNKRAISEKDKRYRENNKDKIAASQKQYQEQRHPDYSVWTGMGQRCNNPNDEHYHRYGGRGITRCKRWDSFELFLQDMGSRPEPRHLYSIERKDVNGNYEPDNCKWATAKEQQNNKRSNKTYRLTISDDSPIYLSSGVLSTLREFADLYQLPLVVAKHRYAQCANEDWILHSDADNRYYEWDKHKYNVTELSLISGVYYSKLYSRLVRDGWSVEKATRKD